MTKEELKERFKQYAIKIAFFALKLPYNIINKNYADQLKRSASSEVGNYRASLRAKSSTDFIYKFKIVEEELDESLFFLELIEVINPLLKPDIEVLSKEGNELLSIIVKSITTLRKNRNQKS